LTGLTLVMPDRTLVDSLSSVVAHFGNLQELRLLGYASLSITDDLLVQLSNLDLDLQTFALTGTPRVTEQRLKLFLRQQTKLRSLSLESLMISPTFFTDISSYFPQLEELKATFPDRHYAAPDQIYSAIADLSSHCPQLASLTLSNMQQVGEQQKHYPVLSTLQVSQILTAGPTLTYLEVRGLLLSTDGLERLCSLAPRLEEMIVHIQWSDLIKASNRLAQLRQLETLHILCAKTDVEESSVKALVQPLSNRLWRVGVRNRLWAVERTASGVQLGVYKLPFWPSFGPF
jgi:hypothetical protein